MNKVDYNLYLYDSYLDLLENFFLNQKLPSSILFIGNEGVGKKSFIEKFIYKINLTQKNSHKTSDFFGNQVSVNYLKDCISEKYPNVRYVSKKDKNNITIDQIRDLKFFIDKTSFNGDPKFIIIEGPEYLNLNAANSLLKMLEAPPEQCYFFLISDNESTLIETIKSRCVKFYIKFTSAENKFILENLLKDYNLDSFDNFEIFSKFESAGSIVNKIKFLVKNNISTDNILNIILFCFNDYKNFKNHLSLKYALDFSVNFFYKKILIDHNFYKKIYINYLNKVNSLIKYNSDIDSVLKIFQRNS